MHFLDAGCGTGNYGKAFLDYGIGKLSAIDGSEGMLARAKDKLALYNASNRVVEVKQHLLPSLPFDDNNFDAVSFIQVVHHLDKPKSGFCNIKVALSEAFRVLKPGGVLLINTLTQKQAEHCMWYFALVPKAASTYKYLFVPEDELLNYLLEIGFSKLSSFVSYHEPVLSEKMYTKLDGPLDAEWRQMDSIWKHAEEEGELQSAIELVMKLKSEGKLEEFYEKAEQKTRQFGSYITIFAQKPKL